MSKSLQIKLLSILLLLLIAFGVVFTPIEMAFASTTENISFTDTNVLDDLKQSTINGKPFDVKDYPFDNNRNIEVIDFVEYCYSNNPDNNANYGLYVYIYNPKGLNVSTSSKMNKIQMAVNYSENGNPTEYEKFNLSFCNMSEESNYKGLFYKFKVVDKPIKNKLFYDRLNSNERRYDISGVELMLDGNSNAIEYPVCGTYKYTGYAKGYGPDIDAESTLTCNVTYLDSISLEVRHTFYRTKTSSKGAGYQNQLDTVYFAVPNRYFDNYGKLQRIKAEWYEYKTNDIVVTSNDEFYTKAQPYLGVQTGKYDKFGMTEYNKDIGISLGQEAGDSGDGLAAAKWGWNLGGGYLHVPCAKLYYLFKTNNITEYDPYANVTYNGGIQSNDLYNYILSYNKTAEKGYISTKDDTISADLFTDDIDNYRKLNNSYGKIQKGYSYYDFDADLDTQTLSSWNDTQPSFWDNWITWGLWESMTGKIPEETSKTISPIYTVKEEDFTGTNQEIAEKLFVNFNDVNDIRRYYQDAINNNCRLVLFRFATSDYYSAPVDIIKIKGGFFGRDKFISNEAYRAQESVFLDFDIIQLSFQQNGSKTVIPAVSSPIDIVNGVTPPVNLPDLPEEVTWWKMLLGVILLIILIIVLIPVLPYILQFIFWLICLPFKLIGMIFDSFKNANKHRKAKADKVTKPPKVRKEKVAKQKKAKVKKAKRIKKPKGAKK